MIQLLKKHIEDNALFTAGDRILIACSGGADSVALAHLLKESGYHIGLAHCNFQLRGTASGQEEQSADELAKLLDVPIFIKRFNTREYAEERRIGIQEAARKLRYDWFESIAKANNYSRIATAHHKDDQLETYLFHIMRGSYWSGFTGVPVLNGMVARPLLVFTKAELLTYLSDNNYTWKHDQSNDSVDYSRNKIRHEVIPKMKEIRPGFDKNVFRQIELFKEVNHLLDDFLDQLSNSLIQLTSEGLLIRIEELKEMKYKRLWLTSIARDYAFTASRVDEILSLIDSENGKAIYSASHRIIRERDMLMITPLPIELDAETYFIQQGDTELLHPIELHLKYERGKSAIEINESLAQMDADQLSFPLVLRKWKNGDRFQPLGMEGNQLLSDYFVQNKLSQIEKEATWIIESGSKIIWIVGRRIAHHVRLTEQTKKTYSLLKID